MKFEHPNCRCQNEEMEITCTSCDSDYDTVDFPKKKKRIIDYSNLTSEDVEYLKGYNERMAEVCPDFEPWPLTEKEFKQMIHEKAIGIAGGIENLNWAKVLVGEMTPEEAAEDTKKYYEKKRK